MIQFFHFYESKNRFDNFHHKAQFLTTAFMPFLFVILAALTYLFYPAAVVGVAAVVSMYLVGIARSIIPALKKRTGIYSPLLVSSASGPVYLAALFLTDPSLTGIGGLILIFGIPITLLLPLLVNLFRNDDSYGEDDESNSNEGAKENTNTEEIETVS